MSLTGGRFVIPPSIYFGGCAFGAAFYVGVYKAMLEQWGPDFMDHTILCGDSAGIVLVVGIAMKHSPDFIGEKYCNTGLYAPWGIFYGGMAALEEHCLKHLIDVPDAAARLNERVWIGASRFFAQHIWVHEWADNVALLDTMKQSFHIPFLCFLQKHACVDGAFIISGTDFPHGDKTLFVGFDGAADITAPISARELCFPNLDADYDAMVERGYNAFMNWNGEQTKKVGVRRGKWMLQIFLWFLKLCEIIVLCGSDLVCSIVG